MKKLVKVLLTGVMALGVLAGCSSKSESKDRLQQIKDRGYIVLGTSPDYAPNEFYVVDEETGKKKIVGSDIALAQAIADEIGVELRISESEFNMVIANVQAGNVDMGIAGFAWKQDRDDVVNFSINYDRGAADSYQGLMIRKEDQSKYTSKEEIKSQNVKVGAQVGSIQYDMALTITAEKNIVALGDTTTVAALLSTGDIDAFVCTSTQAQALMETYDNIMLLPQDGWDMDPEDFWNRTGAIVMKDSQSDSLLEVINKVIENALTEGEDGVRPIDQWYYDAVDLMPFEIDQSLLSNYENKEDYSASTENKD